MRLAPHEKANDAFEIDIRFLAKSNCVNGGRSRRRMSR